MAQVKVNREKPQPPPVKDVTVTLSEEEATSLVNLLGWGVASTTLSKIGLVNLFQKLEESGIKTNEERFKHTAILR